MIQEYDTLQVLINIVSYIGVIGFFVILVYLVFKYLDM